MKLTKIISLILCFALMLSMVACGSGSPNVSSAAPAEQAPSPASENASGDNAAKSEAPAEPITLTIWSQFSDPNSTDGNYIAFYKTLDAIKDAMPNIILEHDGTEGESYKTKLKTSMAANELPDIFFNWGAGTMKPYVDGGLILPLDEYLTEDMKSRILGGTMDNFTFDGKIYGLPYSVAVASLYANTELFEQNNIKIPETYGELLTAIDAFNAAGITPISLGEKDLWPGLMIYGITAIRSAGYEAFNAALLKEASFDTPEMLLAAQKLQELSQKGAFGQNSMGTDYNDSVAAFKQGKAAMMFMGSWLNGDAEADDAAVKGKINVVRFPLLDGGKGTINEFHGGSGETFLVSVSTKYPAEAVAAAAFICENMSKEQYLAGSGMPAWSGDMGDTSNLNRLSLQVADLTKSAEGYVYWLDVLTSGEDADTLKNEIGKLIVGNVTPEEFCQNLQAIN